MRATFCALLLAGICTASGLEGYVVPGLETGEVLMSVHVWGCVNVPGTQLLPAGSDLVAALSAAGGPSADADLTEVRMVFDSTESIYDLESFLMGEGPPVPSLVPGVTVYVPRSTSDWWKEALDVAYKLLVTANLVWIMLDR